MLPLFAKIKSGGEAMIFAEKLKRLRIKNEYSQEQLKAKHQMEWVARMNSICHRAEEIILSELVYC